MTSIDWSEATSATPRLSFENLKVDAKVVSVYDGDTVNAVFPFPGDGRLLRWACRLSGIDTPELRTKDDNERELAIAARDALRERVLGKVVTLHCGAFDKYGRLLVALLQRSDDGDEASVNEWMVLAGYARRYDGGAREPW